MIENRLLECGSGGYKTVFICQNLQNGVLILVTFIACILYLNKV